jgi:toxin ParE1/3/4
VRLELSRRAEADLDEIADYSVAEFGVERALLYLDAIEQALRRLVEHPMIGAQRAELGATVRTYPAGEHRIFYEVRAEAVFVIRLLHKAVDVERHV